MYGIEIDFVRKEAEQYAKKVNEIGPIISELKKQKRELRRNRTAGKLMREIKSLLRR